MKMMLLALLLVGTVPAIALPPPEYKAPENGTIPAVLYVPPSVLALYGLTGSYGPEPPKRPTKEQFLKAADNEALEKKIRGLENATTLGTVTKIFWDAINDETTKTYAQWATAHMLNLLFAANALYRPIDNAAMEAHFVAMGYCRCPENPRLGVTFPKVCEAKAKGETDCEVSRTETHRALDVVANLSDLKRYWLHALKALSIDGFTIEKIRLYPLAKLQENVVHGMSLSDEYSQLIQSYQYLAFKEYAAYNNQTLEEAVAGLTTTVRPEEVDDDEKDVDDEDEK